MELWPFIDVRICFHLISWEQIDGFWWNFVYAVLWLAHEIFQNFSTEFWPWIDVKISIFRMDFDKILFMHWYIWSMLWLIHIIFPNFSTEFWPLIDFRIMFMLNILWNNWWIWSNLLHVVTLIFFMPKHMQQQKKHSGRYHVVLATLLLP